MKNEKCSPLPCSDALVDDLPLLLDFDGDHQGVLDGKGAGTGLTWVDQPSKGTGYIPANLAVDEGAGTLNLTTTKGIAIGSTNSLDNALSVGVDAPSQKTAITTTIARPPAGTGKYEQAGLWFGNNEDNYSKVVVVSTRSGTIIEHLLEVNGSTVSSQKSGPLNLTGKAVTLKLVANPSDRTVTASYRIGTESEKTLGHVAPPGEFFSFDAAGCVSD